MLPTYNMSIGSLSKGTTIIQSLPSQIHEHSNEYKSTPNASDPGNEQRCKKAAFEHLKNKPLSTD